MSFRELKYLIADSTAHAEPAIGVWLWALSDARRRTLIHLHDLPAPAIDWHPAENAQSIGSILYHMALIEADWLYTEVLEQGYPDQIAALFPYDPRDQHGLLTSIHGVSLSEHLVRLDTARRHILAVYQAMNLHDFRRVRHLADYDVTPEWVLHHLTQHEAEHRSEIGALRARAEQMLML
ncbi:MAG: DinB family protein [Roseiflexaceae bacterium]